MFFSYHVVFSLSRESISCAPDTLYNGKFVLEEKGKCDESQMKINSLWKGAFFSAARSSCNT
jgi:hypothetical protein